MPNNLPTKLPNLVYIEGPNSSGKSTLLNIIALSLFGTKSGKIDPMLLARMNTLLNSDYQKVKFELEISSEDGNTILRSRKDDPGKTEIILEESINGESFRPISFERFESKYNLIYDIPNNPTERLYDLIEELKEEQLRYGTRFKEFSWFLSDTIKEIAQGRDPERLKKLRKILKDAVETKEDLANQLPALQNFLDLLEKHAYVKFYYYCQNEIERLEDAKNKVEKKDRESVKRERSLDTKFKKLRKEIGSIQGDFCTSYNEVTPLISGLLPKKESHRFKIWKNVNPYDISDHVLNRIKIESTHYLNLLGSELAKMHSDDSFQNASLLIKVIDSLKEFENSPFIIPKIKVTFKELINILKQENKKNYVLMARYQNLSRARELLENVKDDAAELLSKLSEIREISAIGTELKENYSESFYEEQKQLRGLENELKQAINRRDYYFQKSLSKGITRKSLEKNSYMETIQKIPANEELKPFLTLSEKQIETKIQELEEEITKKRKEIGSLKVYINQYTQEKDRLEEQKPHKYERYQTQLQSLLQKIDTISQKLLNEYNNNIRDLVEKKVKKTDIEKHASKRRYYQEVSKYLGHRIDVFKHIDTTYKARAVDLISGVIITDDNLTIHLADMGTGQSQSAYLCGLLNVKDDNRKIIALFDEIAMMDDNSLKPIYEKMQELYNAKRLLLGILVQKGNKIKTIPLDSV